MSQIEDIKAGFADAVMALYGRTDINLPTDLVERRDDANTTLPEGADETAFRAAMSSLGIGRSYNYTAADARLDYGYIALIEGGQGHKMLTELAVIWLDVILRETAPSKIIFMAAPDRLIGDAEKMITAKVLNISIEEVGSTEMAVAEQVSLRIDGLAVEFFPLRKGESNAERLRMIAAANPGLQLAFVTSCTYLPSRVVDAAKSETGAVVLSYGTHQLAQVKGEPAPAEPHLHQLLGELMALNKTLSMA